MLRLERKCKAGEKTALVFRRTFDEGPEVVTVLHQEDAVDAVALLLEDFSDFDLVSVVRRLSARDANRLKTIVTVEASDVPA